MKILVQIILSFLFVSHIAFAQSSDKLIKIINGQKGDTEQVNALFILGYRQTQLNSGIAYAREGLSVAKKIGYAKGEANCLLVLCNNYGSNGNFNISIEYGLQALNIYHDLKDIKDEAIINLQLQAVYREAVDYNTSLYYAFAGEKLSEANNIYGNDVVFPGHRLAPLYLAEIGGTYILMNKPDSALFYTKRSITSNELFNSTAWDFPVYLLATIQTIKGDYSAALKNYRLSARLAVLNGDNANDTLQIYSGMSSLFTKTNQPDSIIHYAQIVATNWRPGISEVKNFLEAVKNLAKVYKTKGINDSALKYTELNLNLQDSVFNSEKIRELQNFAFNERTKQQEIIAAHTADKNRTKIYTLVASLVMLLLIAIIFWRSNYHRKKAYTLLEKQKQETDLQKTKAEKALEKLQSTQAQLIQSEKMASLGELTAGIAHEIQNPLNFVNNFSDVNSELIDELQTEIKSGNTDQAISISNNIKENSEKINHHGKRADAIVKGMLQHSRSSIGVKEPTDINALADEYLRLSYQGLRAKDKNFNATMKTDFDTSIRKINIIPQDIGRVVLNLINNAFYAVDEKNKSGVEKLPTGQAGYEPTVSISTKKSNNKVQIIVNDNGNGIPQNIVDKIFQPFFTTKPTGQGTGLGLSLSYDIIKAHGGEIKVESTEANGSIFIIQLPIA
ncbi:MAG: ATP-binding protein [Ginsengibacter sp.]